MTTPLDFEDLVTRHQGAVCAIAYAVLRDRARSEEVAQEAFLVAWQKLPGMVPAPSLPGWVCGIARNLARNAARRRRETAMTTTEPATEDPNALDQLITHERAALANGALERLSEREREAIVLYYRGDESLAAVAAALGISEAAAKKRVLRGREHLRAAMTDVKTTLRGTRPGPAFAAGCVAALALGTGAKGASAAAAGGSKTNTSTRPKIWIAAAIAVPAITIATIGVGKLATSSHASSTVATTGKQLVQPSTVATASSSRRVDPVARQQLAARIEQARAKRLATATPVAAPIVPQIYDFSGSSLFEDIPAPPPAAGSKPSDKRLLRGAIRTVQPLIRECYDHEGQGATGQLELYVRLEGEADTGTIATDARVDGEFAKNTALAECVRESLLSIAMPDVEIDGIVDVDYPFTIAR